MVTSNTTTKTIGYALLLVALTILLVVLYVNSSRRHVPLVYSSRSMLEALWLSYKGEYLEEGTFRTLDKQQNNITTSEGQSYTMLRSVWIGDQEIFDVSWQWTKDNLMRPEDNLISWLFGERPDGTYGILSERGGENSASDADTDIALALIFAFARWKDNSYLDDAKKIITDIWDEQVVVINGKPYLAANNVEKRVSQKIILNPSYFAPYAYKIFAEVDPLHDWNLLADTSYEVMEASILQRFGEGESAKLPPDWITIDRVTGELERPVTQGLTTNFGYDALRLPWRVALDWEWNREERAREILSAMSYLSDEWENKNFIYATYSHSGEPIHLYESPAMYGGTIGYFMIVDEENADEIYEQKLQSLYNPDTQTWKTMLSYYDDNWSWFGIALYNDLLPNLFNEL